MIHGLRLIGETEDGAEIYGLDLIENGGPGSGNHGHGGRPGMRGGSSPAGAGGGAAAKESWRGKKVADMTDEEKRGAKKALRDAGYHASRAIPRKRIAETWLDKVLKNHPMAGEAGAEKEAARAAYDRAVEDYRTATAEREKLWKDLPSETSSWGELEADVPNLPDDAKMDNAELRNAKEEDIETAMEWHYKGIYDALTPMAKGDTFKVAPGEWEGKKGNVASWTGAGDDRLEAIAESLEARGFKFDERRGGFVHPRGHFASNWQTGSTGSYLSGFDVFISNSGKFVANAFCPTGEGGGQDNSCAPNKGTGEGGRSRTARDEIMDAAKKIRFSDKELPDPEDTDGHSIIQSTDYDSLEQALTPSLREELDEYQELSRNSYVEAVMDEWNPEREQVLEQADLTNRDVEDHIEDYLSTHSETEITGAQREAVKQAIHEALQPRHNAYGRRYNSEGGSIAIREAARNLTDEDDPEQKLRDGLNEIADDFEQREEAATDQLRESEEQFVADNYDNWDDTREWLRENADRINEANDVDEGIEEATSAEKGVWYGSLDNEARLQFDANGQTYTVDADFGHRTLPGGEQIENVDIRFEDENGSYAITGRGDGDEKGLFSNILASITALVQKTSPDSITFSAAYATARDSKLSDAAKAAGRSEESRQGSRVRLYNLMTKTLAKLFPAYTAAYTDSRSEYSGGGHRQYYITKRNYKDAVQTHIDRTNEGLEKPRSGFLVNSSIIDTLIANLWDASLVQVNNGWVTLPNGVKAFIEGGRITKGPKALVGKTKDEAGGKKEDEMDADMRRRFEETEKNYLRKHGPDKKTKKITKEEEIAAIDRDRAAKQKAWSEDFSKLREEFKNRDAGKKWYFEKPTEVAAPKPGAHSAGAGSNWEKYDLDHPLAKSLDEIDRKGSGRNFVKMSDFRAAHPEMPREQFDKHLNEMRRAGVLTMESFDGTNMRLTDKEREASIKEGDGSILAYVSFKNGRPTSNLSANGGPGSGNFGHSGRPGQRGGSSTNGGDNEAASKTGESGVQQSGGVGGRDGGVEPSSSAAVSNEPLAGAPKTAKLGGKTVKIEPNLRARQAAADYMKKAGLPYNPPKSYVKVDVDRAKKIARLYDAMEHNPQDPEVKAAYKAMADETIEQYKAILDTGLKIEVIDFEKDGDPYAQSPRMAIEDIKNNNHFWVFPTSAGFGSDDAFDPEDNPLLAKTEFELNGKPLVVNDVFRIVHDYFGHAKEGNGMRADGEENAWRGHAAMYSDLARRAMTTETRGQNSWVNFGPFAEQNQNAMAGETHYADQKIGLLPEWVTTEGVNNMRSVADVLNANPRGCNQYSGPDCAEAKHHEEKAEKFKRKAAESRNPSTRFAYEEKATKHSRLAREFRYREGSTQEDSYANNENPKGCNQHTGPGCSAQPLETEYGDYQPGLSGNVPGYNFLGLSGPFRADVKPTNKLDAIAKEHDRVYRELNIHRGPLIAYAHWNPGDDRMLAQLEEMPEEERSGAWKVAHAYLRAKKVLAPVGNDNPKGCNQYTGPGCAGGEQAPSGSMGHKEGYTSTDKGDEIVKGGIEGYEQKDAQLQDAMDARGWDERTKDAIRGYTDKRHGGTMNRDLRKCPSPPDCLRGNEEDFDIVQAETKKPLPAPTRVYRGIYGEYAGQVAQAEPGTEMTMHGFVSTSINKQAASDFSGYEGQGGAKVVLEITAKTGAYVAGVSNFRNELELLQAHNTVYKVKGRREEGDTVIMEMEEM